MKFKKIKFELNVYFYPITYLKNILREKRNVSISLGIESRTFRLRVEFFIVRATLWEKLCEISVVQMIEHSTGNRKVVVGSIPSGVKVFFFLQRQFFKNTLKEIVLCFYLTEFVREFLCKLERKSSYFSYIILCVKGLFK